MARVCFLFNHDQLHQVAHSLPIALAMMRRGEHEVVLASSSDAIDAHLRTLTAHCNPAPSIKRLTLQRKTSRILAAGLDSLVPARKILLYRDNLEFFRSFDALVTSEKTSLLLKTRYHVDSLAMIHTRHGAGDRAIGFGKEAAKFDLTLVSGPKIARRLMQEAAVPERRIQIVGYPKFDLHGGARPANPFPDPTRPTVLYAPHPSPKLSSYFRFGPEILRQFANSERYNLIFAPHVMLFQRSHVVTITPPAIARVPEPPREAIDAPHILIDRGSPASSDMSYTNLADVYIGDASSQVYEFLLRSRPVVHVDAHQTSWHDDTNFTHWAAGPLCSDPTTIVETVDRAISTHDAFLSTQKAMFEDTFSVTESSASERAADAITDYLGQERDA